MAQRLGNARLAIPKVNPNPRIGQNKPAPARRALANHAALPSAPTAPQSMATTTAQPANTVPATQTTPADPMANASTPATAPAPTGLFDLPAYTPADGQPDPRDPTYWANLAKLKFNDEQEYSKGLREQTRADTDYGDALQTAIRNRAVQQRGLGEDAIRGNLGASGWLDRNESEQTTAYTQDRAHASRNKEEEDQGRSAAQKAILQAFGIDAGGLLAEAGERYGQRTREEAQNNDPAVGLAPSAPPVYGGPHGDTPLGRFPVPNNNPTKRAIANRKRAR